MSKEDEWIKDALRKVGVKDAEIDPMEVDQILKKIVQDATLRGVDLPQGAEFIKAAEALIHRRRQT